MATTRRTSWPKCQFRGKLHGDREMTVLSGWLAQGEAIKAFNDQVAYMRGHGFRVRNAGAVAGTVRRCEIHNPVNGRCEAIYWIVPEGAATA